MPGGNSSHFQPYAPWGGTHTNSYRDVELLTNLSTERLKTRLKRMAICPHFLWAKVSVVPRSGHASAPLQY